ncbi:Uncharacterized protein YhaN [Amphibacillus marinus]|uniref:Uncharacterized protein YhaN n=1 Tax=Amphibacillus marinus TaxID=872970 RepID=A0A1H8RSG2_9BACI|nr:AAA family ATPase [Amphibacillus marinus]SEO69559.1 Uncharacterized protein YhaN [Amphibacillus marinus]
MKINKLHIYGFGKWQHKQFNFEQKSFILIQGENEAGKSTLVAFIQYILFGLPAQRRKQYLPKQGGALGGSMEIELPNQQRYTIERVHDRQQGEAVCTDVHGNYLNQAWLTAHLNGINQLLFQKVFVFDVFNLQMHDRVSPEHLGDILLSIGMSGSERIYQTEKKLLQTTQTLFKPNGKKPILNKQLDQLTQKAQQFNQLEATISRYEEERAVKQSKERLLADKHKLITELTTEITELLEAIRVYPEIEVYHLTTEQLNDFSDQLTFPERGEERYRALKADIHLLQSEQVVVKEAVLKTQKELEDIETKLSSVQELAELTAVVSDSKQYEDRNYQLNHLEQSIAECEAKLTEQIELINMDLSHHEWIELKLSYMTKNSWDELTQHSHSLEEQTQVVEQRLEEQKLTESQSVNALAELAKIVLTSERHQANQHERKQLERQHVKQQSGKEQEQVKLVKQNQLYLIAQLVFLSILSIITLVVLQSIVSSGLWWVLLILLLIVVVGYTISQIRFRRKIFNAITDDSQFDTEINHEAMLRIAELDQLLFLHEENYEQYIYTKKQLKQTRIEQLKSQEQLNALEQQKQRLAGLIAEQINQYPFLKAIHVRYWPGLYDEIVKLKMLIQQSQRLVADKQELVNLQLDYNSRLIAVKPLVVEIDSTDYYRIIEAARTYIASQETLAIQQKALQERLSEYEEQLNILAGKLSPYLEERTFLFDRANADEEETFLLTAAQFKKQQELEQKRKAAERFVRYSLTTEQVEQMLKANHSSKAELEVLLKEYQEQLEQVRTEIKNLQQEISDHTAILKQHEESQQLIDVKHDYYYLKDQFEDGAKQWLINQLALKKIEQTKLTFQQSYLPAVLEQASEMFAQLTNQYYQSIFFSSEAQTIQVSKADGQVYSLLELSQGTCDQLFVAIRLAISLWLAKHSSLPFLIDDGFVHFDQKRKELMLQLLNKIKAHHQVIYFSKTKDHLSIPTQFAERIITISSHDFTSVRE